MNKQEESQNNYVTPVSSLFPKRISFDRNLAIQVGILEAIFISALMDKKWICFGTTEIMVSEDNKEFCPFSVEEAYVNTCLSKERQDSVIKKLTQLGFLLEIIEKSYGRRYFFLDFDKVNAIFKKE